MSDLGIRAVTGFLLYEEIPEKDKTLTMERERTFHCAASKGIVGQLSFSLIPADPGAMPDPVWKTTFNTRLAYCKTMDFEQLKIDLAAYSFLSPVTKMVYRVKPGTIKEVRRKKDN